MENINNLSKRKHPRMKNFDYSENGLYFLTLCLKDKNFLLCNIVGRDVLDAPSVLLTKMGKIVEKHIYSINNSEKISVEKFVIMPDHIIRNEEDYKTHWRYIEDNPTMWFLNKYEI